MPILSLHERVQRGQRWLHHATSMSKPHGKVGDPTSVQLDPDRTGIWRKTPGPGDHCEAPLSHRFCAQLANLKKKLWKRTKARTSATTEWPHLWSGRNMCRTTKSMCLLARQTCRDDDLAKLDHNKKKTIGPRCPRCPSRDSSDKAPFKWAVLNPYLSCITYRL